MLVVGYHAPPSSCALGEVIMGAGFGVALLACVIGGAVLVVLWWPR